jgi:hypothetical protein
MSHVNVPPVQQLKRKRMWGKVHSVTGKQNCV